MEVLLGRKKTAPSKSAEKVQNLDNVPQSTKNAITSRLTDVLPTAIFNIFDKEPSANPANKVLI